MYLKQKQESGLPMRKRQRKGQEKDAGADSGKIRTFQQLVWIVLILAQMAVVNQLETRAEDQTVRQVEQEILYDSVEDAAEIPQEVTVTVREEGQQVQAVCRLQEVAEEGEKWQEGFVLPITFHVYDADLYMFEGQAVPRNDEKPQLDGHEGKLLEAAGLSLQRYRIRDVLWDGESYTDEQGELCRDAVAVGDKLVRSYRAYYTGTAVFPAKKVPASEAQPETEEWDAGPPPSEAGTNADSQTAEQGTTLVSLFSEEEESTDAAGEQTSFGLWERITRTLLIAVGIGALLFFLGLLLLAGLHIAKIVHLWYINKRKNNKEEQEHVYRK